MPDEAVKILKDLKLDNDTINRVRTLISWQDYGLGPDKYSIRIAMSRMEPDLFDDLLEFRMCLSEAGGQAGLGAYGIACG